MLNRASLQIQAQHNNPASLQLRQQHQAVTQIQSLFRGAQVRQMNSPTYLNSLDLGIIKEITDFLSQEDVFSLCVSGLKSSITIKGANKKLQQGIPLQTKPTN